MELSPQSIRSAEFKTVRKGADPDELRAFLGNVADELERAQNQSTAMEARARAAVARLQEMNEGSHATAPTPAAPAPATTVSQDEAETISRTLLLAQRTADTTVAEAHAEATTIIETANAEAAATLESARTMSARLLDEARTGARQAGEVERLAVAGEVEALKARRDFLESDVEQLELFLADQRSRLREAAASLVEVAEQAPGGLGDVRPPLLSASDDDDGRTDIPHEDDTDPHGDAVPGTGTVAGAAPVADDPAPLVILTDLADTAAPEAPAHTDDQSGVDVDPVVDDGEPTQALPAVDVPGGRASGEDDRRDDDILFSFDADRR